jgi:beta-phosphoglucomutase family hydrolase
MSEKQLEAVLWDMDGVIADTAEYHYRAWREIIKERGITFKKEDFMQLFGQRHDTIIKFLLGDKISNKEADAIADRKQALYRRLVARNIVPLPGAIELIESLNKNKIKTAIATSAVPENVDVIIRGLGIEDCFQAIAYGTEVAEGKPSPLIFQLAAEKLGIDAGNCVVIEDAIAGVTAAKRAGMKCIAVTNSHSRKSLDKADLVVDTLEKVNIAVLKGLFNKDK